ncbi:MAG: glycosyltransferase family 39 protein [Elusimicrobiota bacterium]
MNRISPALAAAGLLCIGLVLRLGYAFHVYNSPNGISQMRASNGLFADPDGYNLLGKSLAQSGSYAIDGVTNTDREPFYPLVLAILHLIFGPSIIPCLILNALIGVACCWLACVITKTLFMDDRTALTALALAVFYPEWIYYGAYLYREPMMTLLLGVWLWLWLSRNQRGETLNHALMGAAFSALGLTKAAMLPLGPVFMLIAAGRIPPNRWIKTLGIFLSLTCILQAPWIIRNYRVTGRFVAGSTMGGSMMYLSLLKNYDRPSEPLEAPLKSGSDPLIARIESAKLSEGAAQPLFYRACWNIFLHQPRTFWKAFLRKALKLWRFYPTPGWEYGQSQKLLTVVGIASNGFLLILGFAGFILAWRRGYEVGFLLCIPPMMTIIYALYWAVMRFHSPLMLSFMPPAAYALARAFPSGTATLS